MSRVGEQVGYLTITGSVRKQVGKWRRTLYTVECVCGNTKEVMIHNLKKIKSCGCKSNELKLKCATKHGLHGARIYQTYHDMKTRCSNPKNSHYHRYGGRGITVCSEWLESFENFYEWAMANGYTDELTIERIDNDGNYEPDNCTWITNSEQQKNKTHNGGRRKCK